jgi:para-nitrobenzyl esterase
MQILRTLYVVLIAAVAGCPALSARAASAAEASRGPLLVANAATGVVQTEAGAVRGFVRSGIYTYRGIPYAKAERFMPPQKVQPWSGTRLALSWGNICPQPVASLGEPQTFISDTRFWPASEDCQSLNIWTPGTGATKLRPVMVWIHGGGFFSGSSMELPIYDGTNLSRKGDVVIVSLNHRLNVLGFLDLSAYGDAYRSSADVGMLDIVAALHWVHDNIAQFGGDPANVTIFGQSGGGAKVATLLAAPAAQGLFQKAIIESGAPGAQPAPYSDQAVARRVAAATLQELGLTAEHVDAMKTVPYEQLIAAANRALAAVSRELPKSNAPMGFGLSWSPVVEGGFLTESPFASAAPAASKGVPLMVGSTLAEFQNFPNPALKDRASWGETEAKAYFRNLVGDKVDSLAAAFQRAYPGMKPSEWPLVDTLARAGVLRTARLKAEQGDSVYTYLFAWKSPVLDYAWAAGHSSDIAFEFDNAELGVQSSGGGPEVERLTALMSQAWIDFARSGNPGHAGLPQWPAYTPQRPATLIFDTKPRLGVGHDAELVGLLAR